MTSNNIQLVIRCGGYYCTIVVLTHFEDNLIFSWVIGEGVEASIPVMGVC